MKLTKKGQIVIVTALTLSRIPLALCFGLFCVQSEQATLYCSVIFLLAVISDLLDGKLARKYAITTNVGAQLDVWCDFFFILISCLSLCLIGKMNILLPIIIALKFVEFLLTSHWSKNSTKRQDVLLFDPFGRILALSFYCLPIIALLLNGLYSKVQTSLLIIIVIAAVLSSFIRVRYCLRIRQT